MKAKLLTLAETWRNTARLIEQAGQCAGCPLGGVPHALRQCAADVSHTVRWNELMAPVTVESPGVGAESRSSEAGAETTHTREGV